MNEKQGLIKLEEEANGLRRTAFVGVATSTMATLFCIISLPLLYNYTQQMHAAMQNEIDFCRLRSGNIWREVTRAQVLNQGRLGLTSLAARASRQAGYDFDAESFAVESFSPPRTCCGCGVSPMGAPGLPGTEGSDGEDGVAGRPGKNGLDAPVSAPQMQPEWCFDCAEAPAGKAGKRGPKGPQGAPGVVGKKGSPGKRGGPGPAGKVGPSGAPGEPGRAGTNGPPGKQKEVPGPKGSPGPRGSQGLRGPNGIPGKNGEPGPDGSPGDAGDRGETGSPGRPGIPGAKGPDGLPGPSGSCDHCPPPRTAPGY